MEDFKTERKRIEAEMRAMKENANTDLDIAKHVVKPLALPELNPVEIHDYDQDIIDCYDKSEQTVNSIVDLYLNDLPELKTLPYIKNRIESDIRTFGNVVFISEMTKRNYINQMKEIDNGTNTMKMHEIVNQTTNQMRENIKLENEQKNILVNFYRDLRKELGMDEHLTSIVKDRGIIIENDNTQEESKKINSIDAINDIIENNTKINKPDDEIDTKVEEDKKMLKKMAKLTEKQPDIKIDKPVEDDTEEDDPNIVIDPKSLINLIGKSRERKANDANE